MLLQKLLYGPASNIAKTNENRAIYDELNEAYAHSVRRNNLLLVRRCGPGKTQCNICRELPPLRAQRFFGLSTKARKGILTPIPADREDVPYDVEGMVDVEDNGDTASDVGSVASQLSQASHFAEDAEDANVATPRVRNYLSFFQLMERVHHPPCDYHRPGYKPLFCQRCRPMVFMTSKGALTRHKPSSPPKEKSTHKRRANYGFS